MTNKFNVSVVNEKHPRISDKTIKITTISKKNEKQMRIDDVLMVAESMQKQNPKKKLMIKALSDQGYFTLKNYQDELDIILDEEAYFTGKEKSDIKHENIFKVSFYLQ